MAERLFTVITDPQSAPGLMESLRSKGIAVTGLDVMESHQAPSRVALSIKVPGSMVKETYKIIAREAR